MPRAPALGSSCGALRRRAAMTDRGEFIQRLSLGPAVLFLGQGYLSLETGDDSYLREILRKFGPANSDQRSYSSILDGAAGNSPDSSLAWMDERCRRLSTPDWLKSVSRYAWSAVYSSAFDSIWLNAFRTEWRDVHPILGEKYRPGDPRNRHRLHCTFLYGSVNRTSEDERPPLTQFEWGKRRQVAVSLARRLPEDITPLGTLAIEGYFGEGDWLAPEDLYPILDSFHVGQVHIFSASATIRTNAFFQELQKRGKVTLHEASLAATVDSAEAEGFLQMGAPPDDAEGSHRVPVAERLVTVPRDLWNQVSRSAIVLDDSLLAPPSPISEDAQYQEFRNFLAATNAKPQWEAYARGFAFPRDFERNLHKIVERSLALRHPPDSPIILHGQTGTGKSVALGALALKILGLRTYPVLFIEKRVQRPVSSDIDAFCQWAEDSGARATLVIWDGLEAPDDYSEMVGVLGARGRRVVLVGSSYRSLDAGQERGLLVEAAARLSDSELQRFTDFLKGFHPSLERLLAHRNGAIDDTFLVALYRLLPATRGTLRAGVSREIGHVEDILAERARSVSREADGALAFALKEAGLTGRTLLQGPAPAREIGGESVTDVQELTGLVMVPGRFGLRVPLELLVRAIGADGFSKFVELFEGIDAYQWLEDSTGNIEIGPRSSLEARLIVQSRMGGPQTEIAYAQQLLYEVEDSGTGLGADREVSFAVDLLRSMGSQGQDKVYFQPYFRELALTLRRLREERAVRNPRLMLQEANLLREWAVAQSRRRSDSPEVDEQTILEALDEVQAVLRTALDLLDDDRRSKPLRVHLTVELATAEATKARQLAEHGVSTHAAAEAYAAARRMLGEAQSQDPSSLYPLDVLTWSTKSMIEKGVFDERSRAEAVADLQYALLAADTVDREGEQREHYQRLRMQAAELMGDTDVAEQAFEQLRALGSTAGFFLRALKRSGLPGTARDLTDGNLLKLADGLRFLQENLSHVERDARCLDLSLDLWWLVHAESRLFDGERVALPFSRDDWAECLQLVIAVQSTGESRRPLILSFLRAMALFHLGSLEDAVQTFREVELDSDLLRSRRRIVRSYVASTPEGTPKRFNGTVSWVAANGARGGVHVEELRRTLVFIPRDFRQDLQPGDSLPEFHIAFNFLGAIADPQSQYER